MSKVMLVMDEPKTCVDCVLCRRNACVVSGCKKLDDRKFKNRASFCPLRPVPEKKEICGTYNGEYYKNGGKPPSWKCGYNACIDEILKE